MQKVIVLLSGGMNSATALYWAIENESLEVDRAIFFDYGQKNATRAYDCCKQLTDALNIHFQMIDMSYINSQHILLQHTMADPEDTYDFSTDQFGHEVKATYLPGRNIIMLGYAGGICDSENISGIVGGWNCVDYHGDPDSRSEFFMVIRSALLCGLRYSVHLHSPFLRLSKKEILNIGIDTLKVPYEMTYSCDISSDEPCTVCRSCQLRSEAWNHLGLTDPYEAGKKINLGNEENENTC